MKILMALAAAPLLLTSAVSAEASQPREQAKCFKNKRGERFCQAPSTYKIRAAQTSTPRVRRVPPPVFQPSSPIYRPAAYRSTRQVCRYEDHYAYSSRHGYGYGRYNVEPRIVSVDDELRKRDMPVCLRGQYPYER
ncbi:MAG: hypothetical protein QHC67_08175 [Sphingobium sp.]|uniref:hypothetical protein n=1 Tax=Sphingobium sp. TaxID=1912891 RepID=UPI0029B2FE01|nr:hypothetical protein [Sphingobium sp.]MDX3909780.1 hypothetical protein [Sphingobium sp.]